MEYWKNGMMGKMRIQNTVDRIQNMKNGMMEKGLIMSNVKIQSSNECQNPKSKAKHVRDALSFFVIGH